MSFGATGKSTLVVTSGLVPNASILRLEGELDVYVLPLLREHLKRIWELPATPFMIVDLGEVGFCDSMGVNTLVEVMQQCEARGTRLLLGGVRGVMARVLSITGLRNAFEVYDDVDDALRCAMTP
ncbi:STAS domain-containing protein [Nonomuraea sp. NPDC048916]|uniref:STAS domain-containing protein n=1 Tax=Nonomuraea sp. NPDC048916 TaxID=3154232 RepID=UPI003402211C